MENRNLDELPMQMLGAFLRFQHTPWHVVPTPGLSRAETGVLMSIDRAMHFGEKIRVSDISNRMRVSPPTITQHLNNLESQGFVERIKSESDKREVNITLTDKGAEALRRHREMIESNMRELVEILGEEGTKQLVRLLNTVSEFFIEKQKSYGAETIEDRR